MNYKFYITGTRRGLGQALSQIYNSTETLEECDVFINCKHEGFGQVDMLYKACDLGKKVINIGSYASDWIYHPDKEKFIYAIEKKALRDANSQLFDNGYDTCCLNLGYFDSPRVSHIDTKKMSINYCIDIIEWVLEQEYRVKELTVCP
jgi:hypothetical protein|tara:strand:+ start:43 stop:486 length:444 start_codon:yes stop_codon:yes gene_type:complete